MKPQALVATLLCLAASAPRWADTEAPGQTLTRTIRQYATTHAFSGTVLVRKGGKTLYHESFGLADRAFDVPVTNATKFKVASITKAFTAVLILQLVEQGNLDLRAPISLPVILGKIVEKLYGKTFDAVLKERVLDPLGMTRSGMLYQQEIVPNLAYTYFKPGDTAPLINDLPVYIQNWYSAGGMYSTATDLATFADALYGSSKLLKRQTLDLMLTPGLDEYGYGLWVRDIDVRGKPHRVA